jgi:hypothetical protein
MTFFISNIPTYSNPSICKSILLLPTSTHFIYTSSSSSRPPPPAVTVLGEIWPLSKSSFTLLDLVTYGSNSSLPYSLGHFINADNFMFQSDAFRCILARHHHGLLR